MSGLGATPTAQAAQAGPGTSMVRVSVVSGKRKLDAGLPASIALIELLPALARGLGQLDTSVAGSGYTLTTTEGATLDLDSTLTAQNVVDGAVLTVVNGAQAPKRRYDDVVEAVADAIEAQGSPWRAEDSARTAVGAATAALVAAGGVLAVSGLDPVPAGAIGAACALIGLVAAMVLDRMPKVPKLAAGALGVTGVLLASIAAFLGSDGPARLGVGEAATALTAAAGVGLAASILIASTVPGARQVAAGPAVTMFALLCFGGATWLLGADSAPAVTAVIFAVAACALIGIPWVALAATPLRVISARDDAEILAAPPVIDPAQVTEQARIGHTLQLALRAGVGVILVVLAPGLVGIGLVGVILAVVAFAAVLLSVRESVARSDVAVVTGTGVLGILLTALVAALIQPTWRPTLVVVLTGGAFAVVVTVLMASGRQLRLARAADLVQLIALAAIPPLAVVAAGGLG